MRIPYALAGVPAVVVLSAAMAVAFGSGSARTAGPTLEVGTDVGRARSALMAAIPIGTPAEIAFSTLKNLGLGCTVSMPPLSNLTWRIIDCSIVPSRSGAVLAVDVAGRNGVVADIGVQDLACAARADAAEPDPEPGGCELSGARLLGIEAWHRSAEHAFVTQLLARH